MKEKPAPCFVTTIDTQLAPKLQQELRDQGFSITHPPYTLFSAQKTGVSCTLYTSGKLTVQGKDKAEFIQFYLEPEILHSLAFSHPQTMVDGTPRIGVDEAGKGDFFGPLCVAGVFANEERVQELLRIGVRDSKTLEDRTILKLSLEIKKICPHAIVQISPKRYNEIYPQFQNLNRLLAWGHATVIETLVQKTQCTHAVIDQFADEKVVLSALKKKQLELRLDQRHQGESDPVVAAASILARAAFVQGIEQLGISIGMALPKGASSLVIRAGKELVAKHGREILKQVSKEHFKTTQQII